MSSTTPRVSLYKPAGGENVNVTTDINNNLDKLDTNLNFRVVANATARNAITPFWEGLNVRETDTAKLYVSNGSAPISASWDQIATANTYTTASNIAPAATGTVGFNFRTNGDSSNRVQIRGDGQIAFGPGNASPDTTLYRSAANELKTDDSFVANSGLTSLADVNVAGNLVFSTTAAEKWADNSSTTTVANTTTETVIATLSIPANDMVSGAVYKLTAFGTASTAGTGPTLRFNGRIGGVGGTQFATTNTFTCIASQVNRVWKVEIYYTCSATGVSGTGFGNLHVLESQSVAGTTNPVTGVNTRMDGGATHTVDTTISRDLVLSIAWGTASASNTLTCRGFAAERIA